MAKQMTVRDLRRLLDDFADDANVTLLAPIVSRVMTGSEYECVALRRDAFELPCRDEVNHAMNEIMSNDCVIVPTIVIRRTSVATAANAYSNAIRSETAQKHAQSTP